MNVNVKHNGSLNISSDEFEITYSKKNGLVVNSRCKLTLCGSTLKKLEMLPSSIVNPVLRTLNVVETPAMMREMETMAKNANVQASVELVTNKLTGTFEKKEG